MLLTRAPLYSTSRRRCFSYDLHVLGTPPAFVLSQDQTLQFELKELIFEPAHSTIQFSKIIGQKLSLLHPV